jgi:ABC-type phosphate/phosphonate transport system substrate-binding protein
MNRIKALAGVVASLLFAGTALAADYTVTVEPNYPPAQALQVYKPLMDYLSRATGQHFILKPSANYHVYWRDMRAAVPVDFAFEEAHFTDYRINHQRFSPLVRVQDPTKYVLLADSASANDGTHGLIGLRIACMSAPSMGYLLLGEWYKNPIAQPEVVSTAASWKDGVEMVFATESEGAMVPSYIAQTYPNLVPVATSREFVGRAFSAGPTVPLDVRQKVTAAMLKLRSPEVLGEIGATAFVPAVAADYSGNERLLRDVFGYQQIRGRTAPSAVPVPDDQPGLTVKGGG